MYTGALLECRTLNKEMEAVRKLSMGSFNFLMRKYKVFFNSDTSATVGLVRYTHICLYDFAHGRIYAFMEYLLRVYNKAGKLGKMTRR